MKKIVPFLNILFLPQIDIFFGFGIVGKQCGRCFSGTVALEALEPLLGQDATVPGTRIVWRTVATNDTIGKIPYKK